MPNRDGQPSDTYKIRNGARCSCDAVGMNSSRPIEQVVIEATRQSHNRNSQLREVVKNELISGIEREGMAAFVERLEEVGKRFHALAIHSRIGHSTEHKL